MQESIAYEGCFALFPFPLHRISFFRTRSVTHSLFVCLSVSLCLSFLLLSFVIFCVFFFFIWNRFGFIASLSLVSGCGCAVRVYFTRCFTEMCAFAKHHAIERNVCMRVPIVVRVYVYTFVCACVCVALIVHRVSDRDGTKAKIVVSMCCSVFST